MEDYVIASNNREKVIEAFYIENGTVMQVRQIRSSNEVKWTEGRKLVGQGRQGEPLQDATRVEACTDHEGYIHVIAYTKNNEYCTCYQSNLGWEGWFKIQQVDKPKLKQA